MFEEQILNELVDWQSEDKLTFDVAEGWSASLKAKRVDVVGAQLWEIALKNETEHDLKEWANGVAEKVTSLLEPLALIEIDQGKETALLRSEAPLTRGEKVFYYEVKLCKNEMNLRRYSATRTGSCKRDQEAFALTQEAIAKFISDTIK